MANKEDKKFEENAVENPVVETNRQKARKLWAQEIPDYSDDDEAAAEQEMSYLNRNRDANQKLAEALQEDPRMAEMLSDIVSKKRGAAAAAVRYYGRDFLGAEEGTPEWEEIQAAEEERKADMEAYKTSEKEYQDNLEKTMPEVENYCKEKGYDVDDFLGKAWENIVQPIMTGNYTRNVLEFIDHGVNYASDTADAMEAGRVAGRNENINKLREDRAGDGLPKGLSSVQNAQPQKKKRNQLLADALNA